MTMRQRTAAGAANMPCRPNGQVHGLQTGRDAILATGLATGLLVGVGTRYGSGCTSGHGVCGLSRMSPRSLIATLAFMGAGFVTVFLMRHALA